MFRRIFIVSLFVGILGLGSVASAGPRDFVICLPLGEGSASAATRYIKPFLRLMEKKAGWPEGSVTGRYINGMAACKAYVRTHKPGFGLLSQGLYVANRKAWRLKVIGRVDMPRGAGKRLYLVVKKGAYRSLDQLKGKTLKSNHVAEKSFLSKVIFRGKLDAARFFRLRATSSLDGFQIRASGSGGLHSGQRRRTGHHEAPPGGQGPGSHLQVASASRNPGGGLQTQCIQDRYRRPAKGPCHSLLGRGQDCLSKCDDSAFSPRR